MWDTGNYLIAIISAERLGIISHNELNDRIRSVLAALSSLPLTNGKLPAVYYDAQKLIRLHSLDQNESTRLVRCRYQPAADVSEHQRMALPRTCPCHQTTHTALAL